MNLKLFAGLFLLLISSSAWSNDDIAEKATGEARLCPTHLAAKPLTGILAALAPEITEAELLRMIQVEGLGQIRLAAQQISPQQIIPTVDKIQRVARSIGRVIPIQIEIPAADYQQYILAALVSGGVHNLWLSFVDASAEFREVQGQIRNFVRGLGSFYGSEHIKSVMEDQSALALLQKVKKFIPGNPNDWSAAHWLYERLEKTRPFEPKLTATLNIARPIQVLNKLAVEANCLHISLDTGSPVIDSLSQFEKLKFIVKQSQAADKPITLRPGLINRLFDHCVSHAVDGSCLGYFGLGWADFSPDFSFAKMRSYLLTGEISFLKLGFGDDEKPGHRFENENREPIAFFTNERKLPSWMLGPSYRGRKLVLVTDRVVGGFLAMYGQGVKVYLSTEGKPRHRPSDDWVLEQLNSRGVNTKNLRVVQPY